MGELQHPIHTRFCATVMLVQVLKCCHIKRLPQQMFAQYSRR